MTRAGRGMSFRARLALRWAVAVAVLLATTNLAIYGAASTYLYRDLDLKVRTVAATELASSTDRLDIHLHELPTEALGDGAFAGKVVQIFDEHGAILLSSAQLDGGPPLIAPSVVAEALAGRAPLVWAEAGGHATRVAALTTRMGEARYVVAVGLFADHVAGQLRSLAWLLGLVWLGGLLLTAVIGDHLAVAALRPVTGITTRAARIAAGDFSARLDTPVVEDELGQMTHSLNGVLERLHSALEANRRFAADASHELRGPLTAMAGEIDVTLRQPRTEAEYREALQTVRARLSALTALAEDLMLLVRAQEGRAAIELREVSLTPLVQAALERLTGAARAQDVRFETTDLPDLVAYADAGLVARVIDNVLTNAVLYNRPGGRVAVGGRVEDPPGDEWTPGFVVLTVADTGPGIPELAREAIFNRFHRLDQSRTRRTGGSGLGLAICREVLAALGGGIYVAHSSADGTTFEIRLPGRAGHASRTDAPSAPARRAWPRPSHASSPAPEPPGRG
ncbi:MAG: ATP-binding protein [Vicinamibacterales bacterium]|nr:ATP-binding protein [Vicinamibacterales bacterium]